MKTQEIFIAYCERRGYFLTDDLTFVYVPYLFCLERPVGYFV